MRTAIVREYCKLAEILYSFLANRYDSRKWIVLLLPGEGFRRSYHFLNVSFGLKYHCVTLGGQSIDHPAAVLAFAISFPLNQSPPIDFTSPNTVPYRAASSNGYYSTLKYSLTPTWETESAGFLVKVLNEKEPRNHYFVMRVGTTGLLGAYCKALPIVMPSNSPLVKEFLVGTNLKVLVFPKEGNNQDNWEDHVQHEMLDWMERHEATQKNITEAFNDWLSPNVKPKAVAKMLYKSLSSRYPSRQWIVIVHFHNPKNYRSSYLTFGANCHYVTPDYDRKESELKYNALVLSFPKNQTPPADFVSPTHFPIMTAKSFESNPVTNGIFAKESAGLLAKALTDAEPRNDYFIVVKIGVNIDRLEPEVMPKNSPLVKILLVGEGLHVVALPKEDI